MEGKKDHKMDLGNGIRKMGLEEFCFFVFTMGKNKESMGCRKVERRLPWLIKESLSMYSFL